MGQHSAGILGELGYSTEDIERLHAAGITLTLEPGTRELTLIYTPADPAATLAALAQRGLEPRNTPYGKELRAPDGTRIILEG